MLKSFYVKRKIYEGKGGNMKKLVSLITITILLTGCSEKELKVEVSNNVVIEYGDTIEHTKLYDAKNSDKNVRVEKVKGFDNKKIGQQDLTVVFTDGDKESEKKISVDVQDTKKPEIKLKKKTLTITAGGKLSLKDNVTFVKDPVDGDLAYSKKKIEKNGYYIDDGKLNTKKAGTYEVMVIAKDVNGNEAKESFKVVVKKKKVVKPVSEPTNNEVSSSNTQNVPAQSNNNNTINNTNKSNTSNNTNKAPAKNDTSSSGNKTNKPSGNKKDDGKLCPLGKDPYKPCNAILNYKGGYGVYPTIEAAMDDGYRLWEIKNSPYYNKGFTVGPLFNNINHVQAYTIFWDMEH